MQDCPGPKELCVFAHPSKEDPHAKTLLTVEPSCKDEMRVGQKNKLPTAGRGRGLAHGPRMTDERKRPICSARGWAALGKGAAIVVPSCNSEAMQHHLDVTAASIAPGAHAIMLPSRRDGMGPSVCGCPATSRCCHSRSARRS